MKSEDERRLSQTETEVESKKDMDNSNFLTIYPLMQKDIIFDRLIYVQSSEVVIAYCQADEDPNWNFALVKKVLSGQEIDNLEDEFAKLNRKPSIYFEDKPELDALKELLVRRGYKTAYEDSWMFYEPTSVSLPEGYDVRRVGNEQELKIFLDTFRKCYQKDDPQNPYGEWGEGYLKTIADSWLKHNSTQKVECFIFYKDQEPVSVSELVSRRVKINSIN